jgi:hypothetical protein
MKQPGTWGAADLFERMLTAVVDGGTEIQSKFQRNTYMVEIPSGGIQATDFMKMNKDVVSFLAQSGRDSLRAYIDNELQQISGSRGEAQMLQDGDELFNAVVEEALRLPTHLSIAERDSKWVWSLFPTLLLLKLRGCKINVVLAPIANDPTTKERELYRRRLLREMGVVVLEEENISLTGYFFDSDSPASSAAIIYCPSTQDVGAFGVKYCGQNHHPVIRSAYNSVFGHLSLDADLYLPEIVGIGEEVFVDALKRGIQQYRAETVKISFKEVEISRIKVVSTCVKEFKYKQMERFRECLNDLGLPFCGLIGVRLKSGKISPITPPVLEVSGESLVSVEGHTRIMLFRMSGASSLPCIVVSGVTEPLPAVPRDPIYSRIVSHHVSPSQRMLRHNYDFFRKIENAMHLENSLD